MKTATIRDLRYDFGKIEAWIEAGDEVLITRHARPVARLVAPQASAAVREDPPKVDYRARMKRIWGDRVFSDAEVDEMRAFETGEP